jgi:lipopolysaccharide transport system permease protein
LSIDNHALAQAKQITLIKPSHRWFNFNWAELWRYRELLYYFTWRDVTVRYKQTILGAAWAILQPLAQMIIFSFIFGELAKMDNEGIPHPIFQYASQLPWLFFQNGIGKASTTLSANANMLKKIYFPRLVLPFSQVLVGLPDFLVAFTIVFALMAFYGMAFTWKLLLIPFFLLLAMIAALGVSLWLAPLNVLFRDVRMAVPFLVQFWFWLTPAAYSSENLTGAARWLYGLNPMAGVIEGFRWAIAGTDRFPPMEIFLCSIAISIVLFITGVMYFQTMEKTFADVA